jgi:hypothetical protein
VCSIGEHHMDCIPYYLCDVALVEEVESAVFFVWAPGAGTPKDRTVRNFVLQITYQSHDICPIKFFKLIMQISLYFENITLSPAIFQTPGQNYLCVRTKL